jgi:glycine/D-amino acid oxidase-like deaminating enzyme
VTFDFAVVGAGVFGSWCAHFLRKAGASVLLIEQHGPANSRSSSGGESRIIRMGYGADEIYTRMSQRSLGLWLELFDRTSQPLFVKTGVLWLAPPGETYVALTEATLRRMIIPFEHIEAVELARRYPQMSCDGIEWALWEPGSGVLMARRAVAAVVNAGIAEGVSYRAASIIPLSKAPGERRKLSSITTGNGEHISAGHFVFCSGPWLPKIFPELLGGRLFITRQEVFFFGTPPGDPGFQPPQLPTWLELSAGMAGVPDIEARGTKIVIDTHGPPFDPESGDRSPSPEAIAQARAYLARRFRRLANAPLVEARVCQYENTSNGDFVIDRHPDYENLWIVGGGSGHGFKHGPAIGEYVSEVIVGLRPTEPRFSLASKATRKQRAVY